MALGEASRHVQGVILLRVSVVDVNTVFSKDPQHVSMPAPRCDPECIQTVFIHLVDIYTFVLEHETDEVLTVPKVYLLSVTVFDVLLTFLS